MKYVLKADSSCRTGWDENPKTGQCYKIGKERLCWSDAVSSCEAFGGNLLVIQNEAEQQFITGIYYVFFFWLTKTNTDFGETKAVFLNYLPSCRHYSNILTVDFPKSDCHVNSWYTLPEILNRISWLVYLLVFCIRCSAEMYTIIMLLWFNVCFLMGIKYNWSLMLDTFWRRNTGLSSERRFVF